VSKYIISRSNEVNSKSPIRLGGKIDLYQIISTDPNIDNYISIDEENGILTFSGLGSPIVSLITVEGSNDIASWVENIYAITPIDLPQGSLSAGTIYDFSIPNSGTPVTIEFTSGATIPDAEGAIFSIIPDVSESVTSGTSISGNVLTTDYYLSEAVQSYSFVTSGVNITYPVTIGIPYENIDQTRYESLKLFQNVNGVMTELSTTIGTYDSIAKSGFTLTELQAVTPVVSVPIAGGECIEVDVFTGYTLNDVSDSYYNNVTANSIKLYIYSQTPIPDSEALLNFWSKIMGYTAPYDCANMTFYGDCLGTPLQVPGFTNPLSPLPAGIYFMYQGWFTQITRTTNPATGTYTPRLITTDGAIRGTTCPNDCQPARQVIPVQTGATLNDACSGPCIYIVNNTFPAGTDNRCRKIQNFYENTFFFNLKYSKNEVFKTCQN
jgi:hypothetical protein